jgi:hypothetical protein
MTIKKIKTRNKKPRGLLEKLEFLRQLADGNIPYSCFKEKQAVQDSYDDIREKLGFKRKYK